MNLMMCANCVKPSTICKCSSPMYGEITLNYQLTVNGIRGWYDLPPLPEDELLSINDSFTVVNVIQCGFVPGLVENEYKNKILFNLSLSNTPDRDGDIIDPEGITFSDKFKIKFQPMENDLTLSEYLATHRCEGFKPIPTYSEIGDFISFYCQDNMAYTEPFNEWVDLYRDMKTKEIIGFKLKGIKQIIKDGV